MNLRWFRLRLKRYWYDLRCWLFGHDWKVGEPGRWYQFRCHKCGIFVEGRTIVWPDKIGGRWPNWYGYR